MKHLEKLKDALCEELDKFGKSGDITVNSLEKIHKLTDTIKNIDKIMTLESEDDDYSERRMGRGYSRDEASDHLMRQLGSMMEDADPKQREILKKCMRELERD